MVAQTKTADPTVVNDINVDDLFALIEGVRRDAAKGKTSWHVTTTWHGQTRSRAQVESFGIGGEQVARRFSIDIDEPCELMMSPWGQSRRFRHVRDHANSLHVPHRHLDRWRRKHRGAARRRR